MNRNVKLLLFAATSLCLTSGLLYVGGNVFAVNVVTMIHRVAITVEVCDDASSLPIADAKVCWQSVLGSGREAPMGTTDAQGEFRFEWYKQQQPLWTWPMIGTLDLDRWVLRVEAPNHAPWIGDLGPLLPDLPLANAVGRVRVRLRHS